jgi:PAS domain S-box-containing protein
MGLFANKRKPKNNGMGLLNTTIEQLMITVKEQQNLGVDVLHAYEHRNAFFYLFNIQTRCLNCIVDSEGFFVLANRAWETLLGYNPESLIGTPIFDLIHPEDQQRTINEFKSGLKGSSNYTLFENRYRHKDGHYISFLWEPMQEGEHEYIAGTATPKIC